MNRRNLLFATFALCASLTSYLALAQDNTDALRYSYLSTQGTARSMGIGGALGSIGGDFSSLSVNPAGIGIYRSSEFVLTPAIRINGVDASYQGTNMNDNASRFSIGNMGVVLTSAPTGRRYERSKWKAVSFGLGINRVADFNRNYVYSGYNNKSSGSEQFEQDANRYPGDSANLETMAGIGYQSYLLDRDANGNFLSNANFLTGLNQKRIVKERGSMTDIVISLGGNYQEKLMIGATLGIPTISYTKESTYGETDATNDPNNNFDYYTYTENLTTKGTGVNLKLGFIYKATDKFRFGVAVHTPTFFGLSDNQNRSIITNTEGYKASLNQFDVNPQTIITSNDIPTNVFEYSLITPARALASGSYIIGKTGFITADVEYVDYSAARFRYESAFQVDEQYVNSLIKSTYKGAVNFRVGGEAKMDIFMARLGFGYYGTPLKNATGANRIDASAGVGLRFDDWFLDLGFVNTRYERQEQPYDLGLPQVIIPSATLKHSLNTVALTIGFKF